MTAETELIEQFVANEISADELVERLVEVDRRATLDAGWSRVCDTDLVNDPYVLQQIAWAFDRPDWLRWWITTERFDHGGRKVLGPFVSRDAALKERTAVEKADGNGYWVDEEKL